MLDGLEVTLTGLSPALWRKVQPAIQDLVIDLASSAGLVWDPSG